MNDHVHRAAKDGRLDILKQAFKTQLNEKDDSGMTPTLWAAYHGNLEALTLCIKRGGDPNKCDHTGNSSLHLAAQNGHLQAVAFLVKFGANVWQLDNDYNTAMASAGIRNQTETVKYLDEVMNKEKSSRSKTRIEAIEKKEKEKANKRNKKFETLQAKQLKKMLKQPNGFDSHRLSTVQNPTAERQRRITFSHFATLGSKPAKSGFMSTKKFSVFEQPTRKVSEAVIGVPSEQDVNVVYKQTEEMSVVKETESPGRRLPVQGLFPEEDEEDEEERDRRPNFGSMALRPNLKSVSAMYSALRIADRLAEDDESEKSDEEESVKPSAKRPEQADEYINYSDEEVSEEEEEVDPLVELLGSLKLSNYRRLLEEHEMDMEALFLCGDEDLKEIGLPLGPRKKILEQLKAIKEQKKSEVTLF
ncbi:ankyrin repeat and SAM domain-containing protein 4B-like [Clavelina lepadiformis]|uniref:ankyrin repeat and SAM domain-containing protein 4B-like n=1 Tax=Clavelina lepadiformis TaxID=159417 RepID=UPI0040429752